MHLWTENTASCPWCTELISGEKAEWFFFLCNTEYTQKSRLFQKLGAFMMETLADRRVTRILVEVRSWTLDPQTTQIISAVEDNGWICDDEKMLRKHGT